MESSLFRSYVALKPRDRIPVEIADGQTFHAHGIGKAVIYAAIGGASRALALECTLHVPGMVDSLASVYKLGSSCTYDGAAWSLRFDDGTVHRIAPRKSVTKPVFTTETAQAARVAPIWFNRMIHTPLAKLEQMARDNRVAGLTDAVNTPCVSCVQSKLTKKFSRRDATFVRRTAIGALVHSDICEMTVRRTPTPIATALYSSTSSHTLFEAFHGRTPDISHMLTFGFLAHTQVDKADRIGWLCFMTVHRGCYQTNNADADSNHGGLQPSP
ncbi:hypothetical protein HK105_205802 [Polyrhizophydium stewartii]|uniref:GAG-pre-integrase domain-containing protein n=1 Tax=Polyrhizophydium stewartii TaxID=2732419 RepID=A0ABR4N548_9FUNG